MVDYGKGRQVNPFKAISGVSKTVNNYRQMNFKKQQFAYKQERDKITDKQKEDKLNWEKEKQGYKRERDKINDKHHQENLADNEKQRNSNERIANMNYASNMFGHWVKANTSKDNLLREKIRQGHHDVNTNTTDLKDFTSFYKNFNDNR